MCYMFSDSGWICGQIDDFDNFSVSRMQVVLQYAVWDIQQRLVYDGAGHVVN